jgi:hypothetical protein
VEHYCADLRCARGIALFDFLVERSGTTFTFARPPAALDCADFTGRCTCTNDGYVLMLGKGYDFREGYEEYAG